MTAPNPKEAFVGVLASLAAVISILERTPRAKKSVASDKMFSISLNDYRKALDEGRAALATLPPAGERREAIAAQVWDALKEQCAASRDKSEVKSLVMVSYSDVRSAILASGLVQDEA